MNQFVEKALSGLTGKNDINSVSVEDLQRMADEHPYFPIAQLLLAKKLQLTHPESFITQVQKTVLYYTNPFLLHYQLSAELQNFHLENEDIGEEIATEQEEIEGNNSRLEVTENGTIRLTNEEISAASTLARETLHEREDKQNEESDLATDPTEDAVDVSETNRQEPVEKAVEIEQRQQVAATEDLAGEIESSNHAHHNPSLIQDPVQPKEKEETFETAEVTDNALVTENKDESHIQPEAAVELIPEESIEDEARFVGSDEIPSEETSLRIEDVEAQEHNIEKSDIPLQIDSPQGIHLIPEEAELLEEKSKVESIELSGIDQVKEVAETSTSNELAGQGLNENSDLEERKSLNEGENTVVEDETAASDEVAPDPFHPEQEEILEEIEQEKIDKEEEKSSATEHIDENQSITLPVHDEDSQIIDQFVEAQHHHIISEQPQANETAKPTDEQQGTVGPVAETLKQDEPLIPIEPYYTIDYFASQGIRFTPEKDPQDKLGKQLKSFTQWLKHMKKIGPEDAVKPNEESHVDTRIQGIADISNTKREIVTEAMADVLEKQGKTTQAIEVYYKLSFLNPDKSSYFADKIQKLKGI